MKITNSMKKFLLQNIPFIEMDTKEGWLEFLSNIDAAIMTDDERARIFKMLLDSGINPLLKLDFIPAGFFFNWIDFSEGGLEKYSIPSGIKTIKHSAFQSSGLKEVRIPRSVALIESYAFCDCHPDLKVIYEGSREDWDDILIEDRTGIEEDNVHFMEEIKPL